MTSTCIVSVVCTLVFLGASFSAFVADMFLSIEAIQGLVDAEHFLYFA